MAYMSLATYGATTNSLTVLARGLGTNAVGTLRIICSNGAEYITSIEAQDGEGYRTTTKTFGGLASDTPYGFYLSGATSGGTPIRIPASGYEYFRTLGSTTPPVNPPVSGDDHSNSTSGATDLSTSMFGTINYEGDVDYFRYLATRTGNYTFFTTGSLDTQGTLYDFGGTQLNYNDDNGGTNFSITNHLFSGSIYYIKVNAFSSYTGSYTLHVALPPVEDDHGNNSGTATTVSVGSTRGEIGIGGDIDFFKFTPTITANYNIYSNNSTLDSKGTLYDANMNQLNYNDDSTLGGGVNFGFTHLLNANQTYYIAVSGYNTNVTGTYLLNIVKGASPPNPITDVTLTNFGFSSSVGASFRVNWVGGENAESYTVELRTSSNDAVTPVRVVTGISSSSRYQIFNGLQEFTVYYAKVYAKNSLGNSIPAYANGTTPDGTAPYISIASATGEGRVFFDFTAYDVNPSTWGGGQSGLATMITYISPANSSTLSDVRAGTITYNPNVDLSYFTFEKDGNGNNFVNGSSYTIGVRSVDNAGNMSGVATATVTYKATRPSSWNWINSKSAGVSISSNLTAVEWESLGKAINQFRTYKKLVVRDFTVPKAGDIITATLFNQYVNALSEMSPPSAPPTLKTANVSTIIGSDFTKLTTSLNSIT